MRFLRRNTAGQTIDEAADEAAFDDSAVDESPQDNKGYTPSKGHPTPKRREAEGHKRGPVAPPPRTTREAIKRSRANRPRQSKDERKKATAERRARMMAGEDKYLLPRDRGPVRAYVRDLVDSRRNILGLFMPLAVIVFLSLLIPNPFVQQFATLLTTLMLLAMVLEGFFNGRRITQQVREKFPKETVKGRSVGWYAFVRSSQIRKLRVPKPRVRPGQKI